MSPGGFSLFSLNGPLTKLSFCLFVCFFNFFVSSISSISLCVSSLCVSSICSGTLVQAHALLCFEKISCLQSSFSLNLKVSGVFTVEC